MFHMMMLPVNPADDAVAVPPGLGIIQSAALPFNVETVCAVEARQACVCGGGKKQDDATCFREPW